MEERTMRKLHPILQVLIIAVIVLGIRLLFSWLMQPYLLQMVQKAPALYQLLGFVVNVLGPLLAGILCFRVLEKRPVKVWVLLLTIVCVNLVIGYFNTVITVYIGRFGDEYLARWGMINAFLTPVFTAVVLTFIVDVLTAPKKEIAADEESMRIGLFAHVLLLLFTCGIWHLIWIYRVTRYLNCLPDEEYRNPATKLLLCMFVPFYSIYWVYKSAQRIDKLAKTVDVVSDLAVVCLILEIFIPLIPPILMQDKINKIVEAS